MHKHSLTALEYAFLVVGLIICRYSPPLVSILSAAFFAGHAICYAIKRERQAEADTEAKYLKFLANISAFLYEWESKNRTQIDDAFEKLRKAENRIDPKDTTNRIAIEYARAQLRQLVKKLKFPELERKHTKELSLKHE